MKINPQILTTLTQTPASKSKAEDKALRQACGDFEALITNQMLTSMRASLPQDEDSFFAKSYGEKMFQSMLDEQVAKEMAKGQGMGLGEMLYQQIAKR